MKDMQKFDKYFRSWNEGETGYFKVAAVTINENKDAKALELKAKDAAREIEAEITYAWDLGKESSEAWWLEWGGYSLEEEIPYYAAITLPEAQEKITAFDPKDNEFECSSVEELKGLLFHAYDEDLTAADLKRGFSEWLGHLDDDARSILEKDLESWSNRAKIV
ncbi:hypothetical protein [Sneathiella chinensis]|uniref:DUF4376 domain-containing protein n=1 Tax=Sneathiella chinensis TaxID=349750 RepID=A0ABQ5U1J3_9PROT|nr:hypothetical protein [Sneathiella chinensis]GLQ05608.1 hypothetical protein GCM10007924_08290 [Sneathiella chinensis]